MPVGVLPRKVNAVDTEQVYDSELEILSNIIDLKLFEKCDAIFIEDEVKVMTADSTCC